MVLEAVIIHTISRCLRVIRYLRHTEVMVIDFETSKIEVLLYWWMIHHLAYLAKPFKMTVGATERRLLHIRNSPKSEHQARVPHILNKSVAVPIGRKLSTFPRMGILP